MDDLLSLEKLLSRWECAEYISAAGVIIGVAGEGVAEFTNWFTGADEHKKRTLSKASWLVLIGFLALELLCLAKTNQLSGRIIASLNKAAEDERLARVMIEQEAANRDITPEEVKQLSKLLAAFAGQKAVIDIFPVTFEHVYLADTISGVLVNAHWKQPGVNMLSAPASHTLGGNGTGFPGPFLVQGVWISATGDSRSQSAAAALFEALKSTVSPGSMDHVPLPNPEDPRVWIYVGDKPTPLRSWVK
jgi:hypothetical protein